MTSSCPSSVLRDHATQQRLCIAADSSATCPNSTIACSTDATPRPPRLCSPNTASLPLFLASTSTSAVSNENPDTDCRRHFDRTAEPVQHLCCVHQSLRPPPPRPPDLTWPAPLLAYGFDPSANCAAGYTPLCHPHRLWTMSTKAVRRGYQHDNENEMAVVGSVAHRQSAVSDNRNGSISIDIS